MHAMAIRQALQTVGQLRRAGQLPQAELLCRKILAEHADHAETLHLLGVCAAQQGRREEAIALIRQAISANPSVADYHNNLGTLLAGGGRYEEAIAAFARAVELQPASAAMRCNLGNAFKDASRLEEAAEMYRQAVALNPAHAQAQHNLGNALLLRGEIEPAISALSRAVALEPMRPQFHLNLGVALHAAGRPQEASASYMEVLRLDLNNAKAHDGLGTILQIQRKYEEAASAYRRALACDPAYVPAHRNLGDVLQELGRSDEAVAAYRQAINRKPDYVEAHHNLGATFLSLARHDDAAEAYGRALAIRPSDATAHSAFLLMLHSHPAYDQAAIYAEHVRWGERHAQALGQCVAPYGNDHCDDRPLRIGYVSPDLGRHSVAHFLLPLLQAHDRTRFNITCYSAGTNDDEITQRIRGCSDQWRSIVTMSDEVAAKLIRQDQIDILVDLALHTSRNRLLLFARKPAPVQVSYLGYPGTTGLNAIDYRLSDGWADPPESEMYSAEQIVRLPETAWCFEPLHASPTVCDPPSCHGNPVTFGTFNSFTKVTEPLLELWGQILNQVPGSRLFLKNKTMRCPSACHGLRERMQRRGIAGERLHLQPWTDAAADHLGCYGELDVALDTFPYHGTTTTCEVLWMGVPVVTLAGATAASRVGISLLTNVGLPNLVARSPEEYVRIAVALANDPVRLTELRRSLRQRMQSSPLMDRARFARNVEEAYRTMWKRWCRKGVA